MTDYPDDYPYSIPFIEAYIAALRPLYPLATDERLQAAAQMSYEFDDQADWGEISDDKLRRQMCFLHSLIGPPTEFRPKLTFPPDAEGWDPTDLVAT
jgi:hypothetical protein